MRPLFAAVRRQSAHSERRTGGTNGQAIANHDNQTGADKAVKGDVTLSGSDRETSKRLARALMHAALLCGGMKSVSPF
jgi:hypothetical protein